MADILECARPRFSKFQVSPHERVTGSDGSYVFDATIRYELAGGMTFLVLVEGKYHANPIKREHVQVLHQKMLSVGAQKAVLVSASPFQSGALEFAHAHGIALVTMTEGRFTYETKSAGPAPVPTREEAARLFHLPMFVAHAYESGETAGSTRTTLISPEYPEYVEELLRIKPQRPAESDRTS